MPAALTLLALEQAMVESARARCPLLLELAMKMGEGSERPIAEALESLARVLQGDGTAENALDVALERVRAADAKGHACDGAQFRRRTRSRARAPGPRPRAGHRSPARRAGRGAPEPSGHRARDLGATGNSRPRAQQRPRPPRFPARRAGRPVRLVGHARAAVERALREANGLSRRWHAPRALDHRHPEAPKRHQEAPCHTYSSNTITIRPSATNSSLPTAPPLDLACKFATSNACAAGSPWTARKAAANTMRPTRTLREAYHTAKVKFARVWPAMLFERRLSARHPARCS